LVRAPLVTFLCRAPPRDTWQRKFIVRCQKRCTTTGVYRANCYRMLFVVRSDHGKPPVSRSGYHIPLEYCSRNAIPQEWEIPLLPPLASFFSAAKACGSHER
jgi:hypothetical protein